MAKTKVNGASAPSNVPDVLSKTKDSGVAKPLQSSKAKSKELAKQVAVKEEQKAKKTKQPPPESESEASDSDESEDEAKPVLNGKVNAAAKPGLKAVSNRDDDSEDEEGDDDDSEESESDEEATTAEAHKVALDRNDDSEEEDDDSEDESDSDEGVLAAKAATGVAPPAADDDDSDDDDEDDSDEEPSKAAAVSQTKKATTEDNDESEEDSEGESSEEETKKPMQATKRKAEEDVTPMGKKFKASETNGAAGSNNLFVGNLSWNVDEDWLRSEFESFGELSGVRIIMNRDTGRSKGFGYVEFVNASDAAKAHTDMKAYELDGRTLNVDFASNRTPNTTPREGFQARAKAFGDKVSEPSDTLFVGNLSFDVGQDALSSAFGEHGTIMSVRIPTNPETGQAKGFGYVTFSTIDEAKGALEAMQGAYIENRPARLDFSQPRPFGDSSRGGRGGFSGRGGRGNDRGRGGRGGFGDRGGRGGFRGGARPNTTNRGGFGDYSGKKTTF